MPKKCKLSQQKTKFQQTLFSQRTNTQAQRKIQCLVNINLSKIIQVPATNKKTRGSIKMKKKNENEKEITKKKSKKINNQKKKKEIKANPNYNTKRNSNTNTNLGIDPDSRTQAIGNTTTGTNKSNNGNNNLDNKTLLQSSPKFQVNNAQLSQNQNQNQNQIMDLYISKSPPHKANKLITNKKGKGLGKIPKMKQQTN
eukprot:Anaeramoba_flamelloidesa568733_41.p3 GENE.a568733_41~~a568733_41.p3  ORF type:complete len:198 (+),score=49.68 a568733_41:556-1149(+)